METDYRKEFYRRYISRHTGNLYGDISLDKIKKQFPILEVYFGKLISPIGDKKILDIGCGYGGFVYWLQEKGFKEVSGVDVREEQVAVAKKLGIPNISQEDLRDFLKDKKELYDVVIMRDVLEHFNKEEIMAVLDSIFNSLKKRGIVIIQTPNAEGPFGGRFRYYDFTHEVSFTEPSIRQVLMVANFDNILVYPMRPVIHGLKSLIRSFAWIFIELILRIYFLAETGISRGIFTQNLIAVGQKA